MRRFIFIIWNIMIVMVLCSCDKNQATLVTDESTVAYEDLSGVEDIATYSDATSEDKIAIYVCGAVECPGVYYISRDSIKEDALNMAGGYAQGAATTYVNLAEPITEGEQIYFPYEEELGEDYSPISSSLLDGKININTATAEELMTLPGIGESKADAIIDYREANGVFQSIEELTNIPGIKEGIYNNIKDYIVVN